MPCLIKGTKETLILWNKELQEYPFQNLESLGLGKQLKKTQAEKSVGNLEKQTPFT